jgi:GLPGLI family protein
MKYIRIIIWFFTVTNVFSQSIEADYSIKISKEKISNTNPAIESLVFKLFANKDEGIYKIEEKLQVKNELEYNLAKSLVDGFNEYYVDLPNNENITRKEFLGKLFVISSSNQKNDWHITKEKKLIGNYLCFKGTKTIKEKDKSRNYVDTKIVAWFCPEINFRLGPVGFHSLPGLILELHKGRTVHYLKKITYNKAEIKISIPNEGQEVTEVEFVRIMEKFIDDTRKN